MTDIHPRNIRVGDLLEGYPVLTCRIAIIKTNIFLFLNVDKDAREFKYFDHLRGIINKACWAYTSSYHLRVFRRI